MITKTKKADVVKSLKQRIAGARILVFFDFSKLKAASQRKVKKDLDFTIARKTLIQRALKENGMEVNMENFTGPVAIAFSQDESLFNSVLRLGKEYGSLKIVGGVIDKEFLAQNTALTIAQLPSKKELHSQLLGVLQATIGGFINVLSGIERNFLVVLSNIKK